MADTGAAGAAGAATAAAARGRSIEPTPDWEMAKENIQPVKVGRKVSRLGGALAPQNLQEAERFV
jgi:hypothetical protein